MSTILVSVLIPAFNAESWIGQTIESALIQTWGEIEVIVVDDGSTDNTLEIIRSISDGRVRVVSQENRGPCAAYNAALRLARGDFIQYLDADDLLAPDKIETQIRRLREEPEGTIASSAWSRFYNDDLSTADFTPGPDWRDYEPATDWLVQAWSGRGTIPNFAWLTPRAMSDAAGFWDESVRINLDGEYFSRVLVQAKKIAFCPDARGYYRSGLESSNSKPRSVKKLYALYNTTVLCERTLLRHLDTAETRRACAGLWQQFLFTAYPRVPALTRLAESRIAAFGGVFRQPNGGRLFRIVRDTLGWKVALHLQHRYRRLQK
jgi:glycosyltransferase involved in cell wall biosynthesis